MTTNPDSEATLENAVIQLMHHELGWMEWADCYHEIFELPQVPGTSASQVPGTSEVPGTYLGRQNRSEVILPLRLRAAMERLNPGLEMEIIEQAIGELSRDRSTQSLVNANEEIYAYLKEGVPVRYQDGEETWQTALVQVMDWHNPANNDFFLAQQFWITGPYHNRRPDVIGFVNGLPLLLIELKKATVKVEDAYDDNLSDYKDTIPQLFWYNGLIILSNGTDSRLGSLTSSWEHFAQWKKINSEGEEGVIALETMLRAVCPPERLLDLVENFTLFSKGRGEPAKIIAKNHQFLGVNNGIQAVHDIAANHGPSGRLLAHPGQRQELRHALLRPKDAAQDPRQLDLPDHHRSPRPGRPDLQDLRRRRSGHRSGKNDSRPERRPFAAVAAGRPPLYLHADPEIPHRPGPHLPAAFRSRGHHRDHRRGAPQPV